MACMCQIIQITVFYLNPSNFEHYHARFNSLPSLLRMLIQIDVIVQIKYTSIHIIILVLGFQKRDRRQRRVPHFWVPVLKRSVIRSDVLNMHLSVIVTDRTLKLILDNYGFDHYLLKTPACDLQSELALKLKQKVLRALEQNCPAYNNDPEKQKEIYDQYKNYLSAVSTIYSCYFICSLNLTQFHC